MNAHRLNHHDIQAVKTFEARAERKAKAKRWADRIAAAACLLIVLILLILPAIVGWVTT
jgi:lipopolysaccharide/colanic/teichoic acid biosynthesis glycosyltransferase